MPLPKGEGLAAAPVARSQLPSSETSREPGAGAGSGGLTAPPHSALPKRGRVHSATQGFVFPFAFAERTLIKSLPGQGLRTGSGLRAFNKENPPETQGLALHGKLSCPA